MITYLISFVLCSAMLLGAYLLLLQNKAIYTFNRAYLLLSIVFSLCVPLVVIHKPLPAIQSLTTAAPIINPEEGTISLNGENTAISQTQAASQPVNYFNYALAGYLLITGVLLLRFTNNLLWLRKTIKGNPTVPYQQAMLVLMAQSVTPHTFLNYVFVNKAQYEAHDIDPHVLQHELAHVRQKHSLDIILIELLQIFCWLNPVLWLYRRAIQLNHEFLADEATLTVLPNLKHYQYLLINQSAVYKSLPVTSQFNYSITKKRLLMMTKNTPALTGRLAKLATLLVAAIAFVLFSNKTQALERVVTAKKAEPAALLTVKPDTTKPFNNRFWDKNYPHTEAGASPQLVNEYQAFVNKYEDAFKSNRYALANIVPADKARMEEIFKQMNRAQQSVQKIGFRTSPPKKARVKPTSAQLKQWKNSALYGVWIDDKRVENSVLNNYEPKDLNLFFVSKLAPNAINYKNHRYQVDLMTESKYEEYLNRPRTSSLMYHTYRPAKNKTVVEVR